MGTAIQWTDDTWNPIRARTHDGKVGWHCEHVTAGCTNCYAEKMNGWRGTGLKFKPGHLDQGDVEVFLDETVLLKPLKWKKGRKIFVCDMTDLFARFVTDEMLDRVCAVMALCSQHTFQVLTKRPERARAYMADVEREALWMNAVAGLIERARVTGPVPILGRREPWLPLPNVWLGASVEDQDAADKRIPDLLATPAAIRFLSVEPMLGPVDLAAWLGRVHHHPANDLSTPKARAAMAELLRAARKATGLHAIDWVIVGGESGQRARPFDLAWARAIIAQCASADVACFVKQLGARPVGIDNGCDACQEGLRAPRRAHGLDCPGRALADKKGGDPAEWPADLRVRQFPVVA